MSAAQYPNDRNIKLDFFRGLALLIIFINHIPGNELLLFTPSRFGLSDAAEIFVFLSGYAAALAYGGSFRRAGFAMGSFRIFHRCLQLYAAHLGLFVVLVLVCVLGNTLLETRNYIDHLNIRYFFDHTEEALLHLMTLRYVPNYFDILPMYLVVMLWIPVVWALARIHPSVGIGFSIGVYLAMWIGGLELAADPHSSRPWFFNPFGWQLIFFIGFAFGSGWVRPPAADKWLAVLCLLVLLAALPLSPEPGLRPIPWLQDWYARLLPGLEKTRFGPLRLLHFLALAYLVHMLLRTREHWLRRRSAELVVQMGRLSLPIFLVCMVLSYLGGMAFDLLGHDLSSILLINLGGCGALLAVGRLLAWLKSSPWKVERERERQPAALRVAGRSGVTVLRPGWLGAVATMTVLAAVSTLPFLLLRVPGVPSDMPVALGASEWMQQVGEPTAEILMNQDVMVPLAEP